MKFVVKWQYDNKYWSGDGRISNKENAMKFEKHEIPNFLGDRRLYRPKEDPTSWFYMSMCGRTAYIEEA